LRDDEGGLNLDMPADMIADLDLRGRAAGLLIAARFDPRATHDPETGNANVEVFANHRWVRFRNFMAAFEDISRRFATSRRASDIAAEVRNESVLDALIAGTAKENIGYAAPAGARDYFHRFTDALERLALSMAAATQSDAASTFDRARPINHARGTAGAGAAPRPNMRIQLRPLVNNDPKMEHADLPPSRPV
jgi:hypothetical protein